MGKLISLIILSLCTLGAYAQTESDYYKIVNIPLPEGVILEGGGICDLPNGNMAVSTRRGDIYIIENPLSARPVFKKFASGLHEILGLRYVDNAFYCAQRSELTRVSDRNGDGIADRYETVFSWPLTGNYHEYSFGPVLDNEGNMYVTLNVGFFDPDWWRGRSYAPWRGWTLKIDKEGNMEPWATGMRSPCGIGIIDGEFFYADNQGDWIGSGALVQVEKGDFTGHPAGLQWADSTISPVTVSQAEIFATVDPRFPKQGEPMGMLSNIEDEELIPFYSLNDKYPSVKAPAVWLPHGILGISTSEIVVDESEGAFGPFSGQVFIGDQGQSKISRVWLEKVNGEYQGGAVLFREGFSSGVLRMAWASDNSMFVAQTNRGWGSTGQEPYALERLVWTGRIPFEIDRIKAMPDGFEIFFTEEVEPSSAKDPDNYQVSNFIYKYHPVYGSPAVNHTENFVRGVKLAKDNRSVRIVVDSLRQRYIHEIIVNVKSSAGTSLLHTSTYYTLNNIPDGPSLADKDLSMRTPAVKEQVKKVEVKTVEDKPKLTQKAKSLAKRTTRMPSDWTKVDKVVKVLTKPGLKFDISVIEAAPGQKIRIDFENPDDMPHNFLIVMPETGNKVGEAALKLGIKGIEMGYIPDMPEVLYHTKLLQPGDKDSIYLVAPEKPGEYTFVCTYPGHYISMRGKFIVR